MISSLSSLCDQR